MDQCSSYQPTEMAMYVPHTLEKGKCIRNHMYIVIRKKHKLRSDIYRMECGKGIAKDH